MVLGAVIGLVLVLASWWKEFKLVTLNVERQSPLRTNLIGRKAETDESDIPVNN